MQSQLLVVTDPPLREVDLQRVSAALGIDEETTRLKIDFRAPEVVGATDPEPAHRLADQLLDAGLDVRVFDAAALATLPWARIPARYAFEADALVLSWDEGSVSLPYRAPITAVSWKPPSGFTAPAPPPAARAALTGLDLADAVQFQAGVDIFVPDAGDVRRFALVRGLSERMGPREEGSVSLSEELEQTVSELAGRFEEGTVDTRLEDVRPRRRFAMGDDSFDIDMRKMFSFGTLLLRQALMTASPELGDLPQYELGARIAYVLERARRHER